MNIMLVNFGHEAHMGQGPYGPGRAGRSKNLHFPKEKHSFLYDGFPAGFRRLSGGIPRYSQLGPGGRPTQQEPFVHALGKNQFWVAGGRSGSLDRSEEYRTAILPGTSQRTQVLKLGPNRPGPKLAPKGPK